MKKINVLLLAFLLLSFWANAQQYPFNGLDMNMGNLSRLSNAQSRSISPENFTGEKGKGAMADPVRDKDVRNKANACRIAYRLVDSQALRKVNIRLHLVKGAGQDGNDNEIAACQGVLKTGAGLKLPAQLVPVHITG